MDESGFVLASSGTKTGRFCCISALADSNVDFVGAGSTLAIYLVSEPDALGLSGLEQFQSVSVGPLSVVPKQPQDSQLLPPLVDQYLRGLRANTSVLSIVRN